MGAVTFQIKSPRNLPAEDLYAIQTQVNGMLAARWGTGTIGFDTEGGIPIFFVRNIATPCQDNDAAGCHGEWETGDPAIFVQLGSAFQEETALDHEILETMVDPDITSDPTMMNGQLVEIADPLQFGRPYERDGVYLVRCVGPAYFQ